MFRRKAEPTVAPTWLIVGLGNPGGEYKGTRHNVGFDVIERLAARHGIKVTQSKHRARYGNGNVEGVPVCLVRPMTYMNLSGQAVAPLMREAHLKPDHVLVIADDLDLPVGKLRLKLKSSPGGHNGHKSLVHSLGTQEYPRFKIGIGRGPDPTIDHVLSPFGPADRVVIDEKLDLCADAVVAFITQGEAAALAVLETGNRSESTTKPG